MSDAPPELSSIASALEDLLTRIGKIAGSLSEQGRNDIAAELFEVERSFTSGLRRLSRIVDRG